jgi:hypothetical protein
MQTYIFYSNQTKLLYVGGETRGVEENGSEKKGLG